MAIPNFVDALSKAIKAGQMLNWTDGDVIVDKPIVINITGNLLGPAGLNMAGAKIRSAIKTAEDLITIKVSGAGVNVRYLQLFNFTVLGTGKERNGITISCPTNQSWIYNHIAFNTIFVGLGQDGLSYQGSLFESEGHGLFTSDCGRYGLHLSNQGPPDDTGIVSAMSLFGGGHRKNGAAGIKLSSPIAYQEPNNLKVYSAYFVENKGPGIDAPGGISLVNGCGFENNAGCGVRFNNFANFVQATGSSHGPQQYLAQGYLNGPATFYSSSVEGYGGYEGKMKLAKLDGNGACALYKSGDRHGVECPASVVVTESP